MIIFTKSYLSQDRRAGIYDNYNMLNLYYINSAQLDTFIARLKKDYKVFSPIAKEVNPGKEAEYSYQLQVDNEPLIFNYYRTIEPMKLFFTPPLEKVSGYFQDTLNTKAAKIAIFGVKNCDLTAHKIQDFVFLQGVETDSLYALKRESALIISSDCTAFKDVCFCLALDVLPHPAAGFDLNLSPLNDGYLVEVGSKKGEELIKQYKEFFIPAKETQASARSEKRNNLCERLKKNLAPKNIPPLKILQKLVKDGYNFDTWKEFMLTCVECGGCNLICDTCHCFLLSDNKTGSSILSGGRQNEKIKGWDSCLYANYARVAGGANPLKLRKQRLRNRFMKKFDFFVDNLGVPACCGCGRCIEVCPGKIDIREVLKDLAKKANV